MRLLWGLLPALAVVAVAAAIALPAVFTGDRPEDSKMSEPTSINPTAASPYQVATFALG
jgi:hypothetical protein